MEVVTPFPMSVSKPSEVTFGCFITFEGNEGSGKSTQIERLRGRLEGLGYEVVWVREPGGTSLGEVLRDLLKHPPPGVCMGPSAELLLMNASRAQLVQEVIRPALLQGKVVLCDRFLHSTLAYQGYGRGLDLVRVERAIDLAVGETRPTKTLLLDISVELSVRRCHERGGEGGADRFEKADREFFLRVEQGYRAMAAADPEGISVIDASQSMEAVEACVWEACRGILPVG